MTDVNKQHSSLCTIPDLSQCVLIPDDNGVHQPHPATTVNMGRIRTMVGPAITTRAPSSVYIPQPLSKPFGTSLNSVGSSAAGSSVSLLNSQSSLGGQSSGRW